MKFKFCSFCSLNTLILNANAVEYSFCTKIVYGYMLYVQYIRFEFEEKSALYVSNYEGLNGCIYGTCGVQYLQEG